jgi:hypothetical protein
MPSITGMSKTSGVNGETVTLTGTNLAGALWVRFGKTVTEAFTARNSQTVDVVVPLRAETGYISVVTALDGGYIATAVSPRVFTITDTIRQFTGQTLTACRGCFTDAQGPDANYRPGQFQTITLWPGISNPGIVLKFSQFDIGFGDQFYIYNGPTAADPLLFRYVGGTSVVRPDTIRAINANGALTVRFYSDAAGEGAGWMAALSCRDMSGTNPSIARTGSMDMMTETFALWPNPARDRLAVKVENVQDHTFLLFDAQGKLAFHAQLENGITEVALPRLPPGLYMAKCGRHATRLMVE